MMKFKSHNQVICFLIEPCYIRRIISGFMSAWSHIVVGLNNMLPRQVSIIYPTPTKMHYMTAIANKIKLLSVVSNKGI